MTKFVKPDPVPQYLCWECRDHNDHSIRTFKIASCSHFDVPEIAPPKPEKPETPPPEESILELEKEETEEVEIQENGPSEKAVTEPDVHSIENKRAFDLADEESSSDSDTSIRHYL